jgi:hypothetical protein
MVYTEKLYCLSVENIRFTLRKHTVRKYASVENIRFTLRKHTVRKYASVENIRFTLRNHTLYQYNFHIKYIPYTLYGVQKIECLPYII